MKKIVGIFRRKSPDHPWCRLMANGSKKQMYAFHTQYPDHEIGMFEYEGGVVRDYTENVARTMRRVYE